MSTPEWQSVLTTHEDGDGSNRVNEYHMMETLGKGTFAKVKLCERRVENSEPRRFAAKIMSKSALSKMKEYVRVGESMSAVTALDKVEAEINIMRTLYHRNVVLLFEVINDPSSDKIYLILEYLPKGPCMLYDADTKVFKSPITGTTLPEELAKKHIRDIVQGVKYLHNRGICHRDIKVSTTPSPYMFNPFQLQPDNILLNDDNRCHLSDFGCAQVLEPSARLTSTVGTYQFLAPECCSGEPFNPFRADIWAIGVTLYIFLYGVLPFDAPNTKQLFDDILVKSIEYPSTTTSISVLGMDFLQSALCKDPSERPTIANMELHPWLAPEDDDGPISF
ncbi:hypothetical protein LEN26_020118 [Aphanomyces euteiches]|nr:hypothetical protein LEN26_020118 [Aphanomyces euteiches]KAH9128931.1 hypothetical protein AeMF1_000978 [Aphanomyces euteiches]KAH9131493.1 hypothetical protein AeNC1_019594 [Aphanomyces euteiches]